MPSLRQLEYLVALSETLHFRKAAERVNTTQPTLSEQIKALEERLGTSLVERSTTKIVLTPVGTEVVEIARRMLKDAHEIRSLAASSGNELTGLLRLGLPPTIGPYLMERAAPLLHASYPDLRLYVREEVPVSLPRSLEDEKYDVIVSPLPVKGADLESVSLFREPLFLAVATDHPLAKKARVTLADLKGCDVLTLGLGHQLHDAVLDLCKQTGARLRHDFEGTSLDMLREMVVMGLGVTFMPGLYAKSELVQDSALKLLDIDDRRLFRTIGMAWRKSTARHATFETLAEFFRKTNEEGQQRRRLSTSRRSGCGFVEENATEQKPGVPFRFRRIGKRSRALIGTSDRPSPKFRLARRSPHHHISNQEEDDIKEPLPRTQERET